MPPSAAAAADAALACADAGCVSVAAGWWQADARACRWLAPVPATAPLDQALAALPAAPAQALRDAIDAACAGTTPVSLLLVVPAGLLHVQGRRQGDVLHLLVLPAPPQSAPLDFLAAASHELRTPLQALLAFAAQVPADSPALQGLQQAADLLQQRVDDLLDFSRLRLGRLPLSDIEPIDLGLLFDRLASLADSLRGSKPLRVRTRIDASCPHQLRGDARRLEQVLVNLLGNAVKYTAAGTVALRARLRRRVGDRVTLRLGVADTGIGIAFDRLDRVGRPFDQADSARPGSGLGLAVVQELLSLFGSRLQVASVAGGGSIFWFDVDLQEQGQAVPTLSPVDGARRVLVVDDSEIVRLALQGQLQALGAQVSTAGDVAGALALAAQQAFDLVLADLQLPDGSGLDLLQRWPQARPDFALLSGHLPDAVQLQARALGVRACLRKPCRPDELQALLQPTGPAAADQAAGIG